MFNFFKKYFSKQKHYHYDPVVKFINTEIGKKYGVVGSTHGNVIAYKKIIDELYNLHNVEMIFHSGDIMDGHGGYIETMELTMNDPRIEPVAGNHDLLLINADEIHNYGDEHLVMANKAWEKLRNDPNFKKDILEPIEILGLDKFDNSSVVIKARTKTKPIRQWAVGREFNKRLKSRFDELDIEIPFPHVTLYMGKEKDGSSAPLNVNLDKEIKRNSIQNENRI